MKRINNLRWAVITASILSGPVHAAGISCDVTPANSIITEGQALRLQAECNGNLSAINWMMDDVSVTGDVSLDNHTASQILYFTTPVGLGGNNRFSFTVTGTPDSPDDTFIPVPANKTATVVIKPTSAVVARAAGSATPTTPVDAACGSAAIAGLAVQRMPTGGEQCDLAKGKPALAITGPTSFSWSCISLTHGAETSCYVPRGIVYTVTADDGGSTNGDVTPTSQSVNSGQPATVTALPATTNFNTVWGGTCGGTPSGNTFTISSVNANCNVSASFVQQQLTYTVTASAGTGGTISPNGSQTVNANATPGYTVAANSGFTISGVTGCRGALNGSTYTIAPVTETCNVVASFSPVTPPPSSGGTDPGSGFWSPAGTTNRVIASQSGTEVFVTTSYVPGCLNGENAIASNNGCAANAVSTSNFSFGSGKVLGLRYMPKAGASTSQGSFVVFNGDGGQVGQTMKVWLSRDPAASYEETPELCKNSTTINPVIITGRSERRGVYTNYCPITEGVRYYLLMSVDATATNPATWRYKVDESAATFN